MWNPFKGELPLKKKVEGGENNREKDPIEDVNQLLNTLNSLPNFGEGYVESYTRKALEELGNDKEAINIFKQTVEKFNKLQKEVPDEVHREVFQIENARDNPYGDKKNRNKFRATLWGMTTLFGAFTVADLVQRGIQVDVPAITFYGLPATIGAIGSFAEYHMHKIVSGAEKKIKPTRNLINYRHKLQSFLEYVSLMNKKEENGYSYNEDISKKLGSLNLDQSMIQKFFELHKDLVENKSVDLLHSLVITGRYASKLDNENETRVFLEKLVKMDIIEREGYEEFLSEKVKDLSENKGINDLNDSEYKLVCKEVYPPGNYDTYKFLDEYKDRSNDLNKYKFNREGMDIYIDGMSGYKLKEGETAKPEILQEYAKRLQKIEEKCKPKVLEQFLNTQLPETKAETLEGKLISYLQQENYSKDAFDAIIAYQLGEAYGEVIHRSQDQVNQFEDAETKEYIQLAELVDIYGDDLKETIKRIAKNVSEGKDANLFESTKILSEDKLMLGDKLSEDLKALPEQARRDAVIQKKVETMFKTNFQKDPEVAKMAKSFAEQFSVNDLSGDISQLWQERLKTLFSKEIKSGIDTSLLQTLQNRAFQEIQSEAQKYQELAEVDDTKEGSGEVKMKKLRHLKSYFSKNKENAHARSVAHICLANDPKMLENPDYFELVMFDPDRKKNVGTTMLLAMQEDNGKKYLLYNPNPSVGLVSEVSAKRLYKTMTDQVINFAEENNFDGILANTNHGQSTNRGGLFLQALQQSTKKENGVDKKINLEKSHLLGGGYTYKDNLSIVWEK